MPDTHPGWEDQPHPEWTDARATHAARLAHHGLLGSDAGTPAARTAPTQSQEGDPVRVEAGDAT